LAEGFAGTRDDEGGVVFCQSALCGTGRTLCKDAFVHKARNDVRVRQVLVISPCTPSVLT
jgi:hypothetical protein